MDDILNKYFYMNDRHEIIAKHEYFAKIEKLMNNSTIATSSNFINRLMTLGNHSQNGMENGFSIDIDTLDVKPLTDNQLRLLKINKFVEDSEHD